MTVRIGILHDLAQADGGESTAGIVRFAVDEVAASRAGASLPEVELTSVIAEGHPRGTPESVASALRDLASDADVLTIIGPAISDNALACVAVADELQVPCINYTGSEQTRSEWMFHYQVGSLEDEPFVIARHLAEHGLRRVALVREDSFIGRQYASFFDDAVLVHGLEHLGTVDLDVSGDNGDDAVADLDSLAPDAVVYFGLGASARGLSIALRGRAWPVVTNSALMFGHMNPDWTADFEGWTYCDAFDDDNPLRQLLHATFDFADDQPGPTWMYDMGRLAALGISHAPTPTRGGVRNGLERVKQVPSALGSPGTVMGFGRWKRCALEGGYLVLRRWHDGRSVLVRD